MAVGLALCEAVLPAQAPTPASSESAVGQGSGTLKLQSALYSAVETKLSRKLKCCDWCGQQGCQMLGIGPWAQGAVGKSPASPALVSAPE